MIDFDILSECGTTNERLREFFTAEVPSVEQKAKMTPAQIASNEVDVKARKRFQEMVSGWLQEHVVHSLHNHKIWSAVDLAWDSVPIQKNIFPLIQYAQGRIDPSKAEKALRDNVPDGATYVSKNDSGQTTRVDLPKFTEMNINLIRSVIMRRVAAQVVKYAEIWPHFKYEPRSNTQVGRLRGDLTSQRMDIMADQYAFLHSEEQACRDMFLYTDAVLFPRSSWEREVQWEKKDRDPSLATADGKIPKQNRVIREGISWVLPHRSRLIYDIATPLASLNTDTGCKYVGFWDVLRWGQVAGNPEYFNRDKVMYSADAVTWFTTYQAYFNQYFDKVLPPPMPGDPGNDPTIANDRKMNVGVYTGNMDDSATFFTHLWVKVNPRDWRWGSYPYPIWVHLKVAGDSTVVYADIMPSSPAAAFSFNSNDSKLLNLSVAHELMQFQDQLTNLFSQLLECIKADLFSVAILNTDVFPDTPEGKKVLEEFRAIMKGKSYYAEPQILEASFEKLSQVLGRDITADMVFKVVRSAPNTQLMAIFEAITRVIAMAEKMMVLSAHEQGQTASHEITASESNQIANSTDTIYGYISNALDRGRAAMKRICYESLIALGSDEMTLPVVNRYPNSVIEKAGFKVTDRDEDDPISYVTVMGSKRNLVHEYIFTSRDGGNRASNAHAAQVLVQAMQSIGSLAPPAQNAILAAMGKEKLYEWFNAVFRLADAGVDMKLELRAGDTDELLPEQNEQLMQQLVQMAQQLKQNVGDVQQMKQLMQKHSQMNHQATIREMLNYKDCPPSIQRQIEAQAGFQPAMNEPQSSTHASAIQAAIDSSADSSAGM